MCRELGSLFASCLLLATGALTPCTEGVGYSPAAPEVIGQWSLLPGGNGVVHWTTWGDAEKELDTGLRNWGVRMELQLGIWELSVGRYGFKPCYHVGSGCRERGEEAPGTSPGHTHPLRLQDGEPAMRQCGREQVRAAGVLKTG